MIKKDCKHYDPPSGWDGADGCLLRNDWFIPCENCERYESKNKQTNADHIRAMSDEELAWELCRIQRMPFYKDDNDIDEYEVECWAKWLKEEARTIKNEH